MKFDPWTCKEKPYPSLAKHYRDYHGGYAWLYNPWNGIKRYPLDVGSDPQGVAISS